MNLKEEILEICNELEGLDSSNFSWQKVRELYKKGKERMSAAKSAGETENLEEAEKNIVYVVANEVIYKFIRTINEGESIPPEHWPSNEELNFFQEIADKVPQLVDWLEKKGLKDQTFLSKTKEKNEQLKQFIQQERKKHGYSSTNRPTNKPNPPEEKKIQDQQKEIDYLKKQLTELQNQIEQLKKNQNNSTDNQTASQIESLQEKKQKIQSKLEQKQSQQKELKDKVNSQQSNNGGFNLIVYIIPGAVLLVIMGIIIAYLVGKKRGK